MTHHVTICVDERNILVQGVVRYHVSQKSYSKHVGFLQGLELNVLDVSPLSYPMCAKCI